jgi:uncharacterized membrane protein
VADGSFARQLHLETESWVAQGLVSREQAEALRRRYPLVPEERRSRAVAALAIVGAFAVGAGAIGFFAANWDAIPHGGRLALLLGVTAGAYALAYHLRDRTGALPRVGEAMYVVGVLLFGASLFLVGQMYHVEAHDPLALLLWAGGAAATALVARVRALDWIAVALFTAWIGFELGLALDDLGGEALAALPALAMLYGAALYGLATLAQERVRAPLLAETAFPTAGRCLGLPILAGGAFVFTFSEAADELGAAGDELDGLLFGALVLLAAAALASAASLGLTRRRSAVIEAAALATVVAAALVAVLAGGDGALWAIVFNLLFAGGALGLVYVGYLTDEPWLVNLGVVLVAVDLVARYFDVFWDALPRSLGMIGAGVLILAIAYLLERQRRRVLAQMTA